MGAREDSPAAPRAARVREAGAADADVIGRLLHDFNEEFGDPAPDPSWLAGRIAELLEQGSTAVLLAGDPPHGLAVLRFRSSLWIPALECYLAELYVVPQRRGEGAGRALMLAALALARERGAGYMDLGTSEHDAAARALYESLGFSNREGKAQGPVNYYYELDL